jgi:MoaA/NifB/PqqE/SkfB family radical SAM enzyme
LIPHNVELGDGSAMKAQAFRMLDNITMYKLGRSKPFSVSYNVTYRCNRRCMFCDLWKMNAPELTTEDAKIVIGRIADSGVKSLGISGGEPLIRKDLEEIAEHARERGIITGLNTNGILITKKRAPAIAKAFDAVSISLEK